MFKPLILFILIRAATLVSREQNWLLGFQEAIRGRQGGRGTAELGASQEAL